MNKKFTEQLVVVGADANTLKGDDCSFPMPGLSAVVGVSGSGKSSLLEATIAAELARRNTVFHGLHRTEYQPAAVGAFVGRVPVSLFVGQRPFRASVRTTVATASGMMGDLRQLFLADGQVFTPESEIVEAPNPAIYGDWLCRHYRGRVIVWAVPLRWERSDGVHAAQKLLAAGIGLGVLRAETDSAKLAETGRMVDLRLWKPLRRAIRHSLEAEVGRMTVTAHTLPSEVGSMVRKAWLIAGRDVILELPDAEGEFAVGRFGHQVDCRRDWVHPRWPQVFRAPNIHLLSFNSPDHQDGGACPQCRGIGRSVEVVENALVPHPELSMKEGAFALASKSGYKHLNIQHETIEALNGRYGFRADVPWDRLPPEARNLILRGTGNELIQGIDHGTEKKKGAPRQFEGFRSAILRRISGATPASAALSEFVEEGPCSLCKGSRWSPTAQALRAGGIPLPDWLAMPMSALPTIGSQLLNQDSLLSAPGNAALRRLIRRAEILDRVGLGHIRAERGMSAVSDGEARRLQIGAVLSLSIGNLVLLLDEPARGLHEADLPAMISVMEELATRHTVLLNEHRERLIAAADHVVELGPGAGPDGGRIVREGPPVAAREPAALVESRIAYRDWLEVSGASIHNVQNQYFRMPIGALTAIVGVSGSGKSSFVHGVLVPAMARLGRSPDGASEYSSAERGSWSELRGASEIDHVHTLDQRVPPRNRRSLVGTLTSALDPLAMRFAETEQAAATQMAPESFRLNGGSGRCVECLGTGTSVRGDREEPCLHCGGLRFGPEALRPLVAMLNIAETLDRPVSDLRSLWKAHGEERLLRQLEPLFASMTELGIGHVALGRRVDSLSGGEVQRLRAAVALAVEASRERHLFILDEPAAGLHALDAEKLVGALRRMVDNGRNTVLVVEHNLHLVRTADWVVEFGPGAGARGGQIIGEGCPATVATLDTPTGVALRSDSTPRITRRSGELPVKSTEPDETALLLDRLVHGDVDAEDRIAADDPLSRLLAKFERVWEIGELNLEIVKLLLDRRSRGLRKSEANFLELWDRNPEAQLALDLQLPERRYWGGRLPRSAADASATRAKRLALAPLDGVYVVPGRLTADRSLSLRHALAVGGGYVELRGRDGRLLAQHSPTPMNLRRDLVGPGSLSLRHLSRFRPDGHCPACSGSGTLTTTEPGLLMGAEHGISLEVGAALSAEAAVLFRGIWRAEVRPLLRRLQEEGITDIEYLREVVLFGCWSRPGFGSFLKSTKSPPDVVASWLRWDGLYRAVWTELPRSVNSDWRRRVEMAKRTIPCLRCAGSGHGDAVQLVSLANRTLSEWLQGGTFGQLFSALTAFETETKRQRLTRERLLYCLQPIADGDPARPLASRVEGEDPLCRALAMRMLEAFTTLEY